MGHCRRNAFLRPLSEQRTALLQCSALTGPVDCVDRSSCLCPYLVTLSQCNVLVVPVDYLGRCRHNSRCLQPLSKQRTALSQCSALAKPVDYLGRCRRNAFLRPLSQQRTALSQYSAQSRSIKWAAAAAMPFCDRLVSKGPHSSSAVQCSAFAVPVGCIGSCYRTVRCCSSSLHHETNARVVA